MGCLMAIGWYTDAFDSAISPWTTLGPLALVVSISLAQEGAADLARHRSDGKTNRHPCVVLTRADELKHHGGEREDSINDGQDVAVRLARSYANRTDHPGPSSFDDGLDGFGVSGGGDEEASSPPRQISALASASPPGTAVDIAFQRVMRKNIRAGHIVLVRNREMIPADLILLASSSEGGTAYVETSSIDGETNLKLRSSPHLPRSVLTPESTREMGTEEELPPAHLLHETLAQATKRMTRFSALGYPDGVSASANASNPVDAAAEDDENDGKTTSERRRSSIMKRVSLVLQKNSATDGIDQSQKRVVGGRGTHFVAALTSEPPNASVNTYSGMMTFPPVGDDENPSIDVPLNAENILLRGAMLRNTEWVIGLACFTGTDTKLVQNSFETPSKFSRLDHLINRTVILILTVMLLCVLISAALSVYTYSDMFDTLWYSGYNTNATDPWPYLQDLPTPQWDAEAPAYGQQVFLFITLLNNFVPLSLYVTVEMITLFMMYLINRDVEMYHEETDTRAVARSTIVTDLGQVQYIFSDKTGTLTCNIMRFKRCSVDGMAFGAPIEKASPKEEQQPPEEAEGEAPSGDIPPSTFHPLKRLLIGAVGTPETDPGLEKFGEEQAVSTGDKNLTFNAEMFLRVMSICHTVVVEKDLDRLPGEDEDSSKASKASRSTGSIFGRLRSRAGTEASIQSQLETVNEEGGAVESPTLFTSQQGSMDELNLSTVRSSDSQRLAKMKSAPKGADGAPHGYAYQAESPDEGALVSAASLTYGFQLLGRSSTGVELACQSPSLLSQEKIAEGLKNGSLSPKALAAQTAMPGSTEAESPSKDVPSEGAPGDERFETWELLAVNKFDSDRKRMSVVVRSPPELGSVPMLLCKGADSAMLDGSVCDGGTALELLQEDMVGAGLRSPKGASLRKSNLSSVAENETGGSASVPNCIVAASRDEENWDVSTLLGMQAHLGDFASEGLRTLVLGVRILPEEEVEEWLATYKAAAKSIKNREKLLTSCALAIEKDLHIVGATAIEDRLQDGVPETIHNLEEAGIKLWVLTGDKRETAIEIGYSTKVLTPKMHLTVVSDGEMQRIRAQMAMEFIRLIKYGKLPNYRRQVLNDDIGGWRSCVRSARKMIRIAIQQFKSLLRLICCFWRKPIDSDKDQIYADAVENQDAHERRQAVRKIAEKIIHDYMENHPEGRRTVAKTKGKDFDNEDEEVDPAKEGESPGSKRSGSMNFEDEDLSLTSDDVPAVFNRASSARAALDVQKSGGKLTMRNLSLASVTSHSLLGADEPVVDEDVLSLASFVPGESGDVIMSFDRKKRTVLERLFAVDREVRKGQLNKHLTDEMMEKIHAMESLTHSKGAAVAEFAVAAADHEEEPHSTRRDIQKDVNMNAPRALVIEGAALAYLLGDPLLEELLFAVASCCDAVIACRVSPKQKALLVKLVRNYVSPTPVTLAIGDGANDVGMIQEAHVGIGISGLEGQQAVNASDFAIAQFRFLQDLVIIHGRWNFLRMARVVLFSFYKNAAMAGTMIVFGRKCLYSGTPLYDMWVISMLNFLAGIPILFLGMFDRDLDREYVKRNPIVYKSGPNNEHLTLRVSLRWVLLTVVHIFAIYSLSENPLAGGSGGGGVTSAFTGLMHNADRDSPGDGEGGDLKVFGTSIFTYLIFTLAYKVLYESRSIINGLWPACTWRKGVGQGWPNRVAWTWVGILWGSIAFFFFAMYTYQLVGRSGASSMSPFVMVANHTFNTRSITWLLLILVPTAACVFDVVGKVFGNMYYPTQTQIHCEIEAAEVAKENRRKRKEGRRGDDDSKEDVHYDDDGDLQLKHESP